MIELLYFLWNLLVLWFFCAGFSYLAHEHMGLVAPWDRR